MFFPFIWSISVSVYDAFVFRRARQLTNISAEQEVSPVSAIVSVAYARASSIDACQTVNERRRDANRGDILSSHFVQS